MNSHRPCRPFLLVLLVKLVSEGLSRWSDNMYLTGWAVYSALLSALVVAVGFPVARQAIVKDDRASQVAICFAVLVTTWAGSTCLQFTPR